MEGTHDPIRRLPNGDLHWIPPKFGPSRDRAEDDRDSRAPAILAALMADMDVLVKEWQRHAASNSPDLLRSIGADMADKWQAIREAQKQ